MSTKLETLRLRVLALRSSIHNEHQLSAIELAGMVAKKTNEIIDCVNEIITDLENVETKLNVVYDEATENLKIE